MARARGISPLPYFQRSSDTVRTPEKVNVPLDLRSTMNRIESLGIERGIQLGAAISRATSVIPFERAAHSLSKKRIRRERFA